MPVTKAISSSKMFDLLRGATDWNSVSLTGLFAWEDGGFASRGLNAVSEAFPPQIETFILGETLDWNVYGCYLPSHRTCEVTITDRKAPTKFHCNITRSLFFFFFSPRLHLLDVFRVGAVVVSCRVPLSDCDAWGQKSTASCLDFYMVLSVLAYLIKKINNSSPVQTTTLLLCLSLLTNFVDELCFHLLCFCIPL